MAECETLAKIYLQFLEPLSVVTLAFFCVHILD
jgi:hypothetical protein